GDSGPAAVGVGGVSVSLVNQTTLAVVATTTTDSKGLYTFNNVAAGSYRIVETHPTGYLDEKAVVGSAGGMAGFGQITNVTLTGSPPPGASGYNFAVDRPPTITSTPAVTTPSNKTYTYNPTVIDPENDPLHFKLVTGPSWMSFDPGSGRMSGTPTSGDVGSQNVQFQVDDGRGGVVTQSFTLTVVSTPPNQPPLFVSIPVVDAYIGTPYTYQAIATDPNGDALTYTITTGPAGLAIPDSASGLVQWNPTLAQLGNQQVTVKVDDGNGGTATQTYTVVVHPTAGDHPPAITSAAITSVVSGQPYEYDVTAVDPDNDSLSYSLTTFPTGMTIDRIGGQITWSTSGVALGAYNVTVRVDDGHGLFGTQSFVIAVTNTNEIHGHVSAVVVTNNGVTAHTWQPLVPGQVSLSPINTGLSQPTGIAYDESLNSLIVSVNSNTDGTPNNFARIASDGSASTFSDVHGLTDEIEIASARSGNLGGFTPGDLFTGNGADGQVSRITDNGQTLIKDWVTLPGEAGLLRGDLTFDTTGLFGYQLIVVTTTGGIWEVTAQGTATHLADVGHFLEGVAVLPNDPNRYGPLAGKIVATAEMQKGVWSIDTLGHTTYYDLGISDLETLDLIPANSNFYGVNQGSNLFGAPASDFTSMVGDILLVQEDRNDSGDVENNSSGTPQSPSALYRLSWDGTKLRTEPIILASGSAQTGHWEHVTFAPMGLGPIDDARTPSVRWKMYLDLNNNGLLDTNEPTASSDRNGNYVFRNVASGTYTLAELSQPGWSLVKPVPSTYTITLTGGQVRTGYDFLNSQNNPLGVDQLPAFTTTAPATANVGTAYIYTSYAGDLDHEAMNYSLTVKPDGMEVNPLTGVVTWTPTRDQIGTNQVILRVDDGRGGDAVQSFQITVTDENYPPTITTLPSKIIVANGAYQYAAHATDPNGDSLTYTFDSYPSGMTIDHSTGLITWTATTSHGVILRVTDTHGGYTLQTFFITVVPVDEHPPVITSNNPRTSLQIGRTYAYQVLASDPDGDPLTYTLDTQPAGMSISSTGLITWTPTVAQFGANAVSLHVSDGRGGSAPQSFTIKITSQGSDQPPSISSTSPLAAIVGQTYSYALTGSDPDGDPLEWSLVAGPEGMSVNQNTGVLTWSPVTSQIGTQTATVKVDDGQGKSVTQTFGINVYGALLSPVITSSPSTVASVGTPYAYQVLAADPQGYHLKYYLLTAPAGMVLYQDTGLVYWSTPTPDPTTGGPRDIVIQVTDGIGPATTQEFNLFVANNLPPAFTSTPPLNAAVGRAYSYTAVATDPNGDTPLVYSLVGQPSGMSISSTGVITWTPTTTPSQAGTYTITVKATDPSLSVGSQTFTLVVTNDHAPTISSTVPTNSIIAGQTYSYQLQASDVDGDPLTYKLQNYPTWMTVTPQGLITGTAPGNLATTAYSSFS
ncbi:putative Ig domain-containing protein, partial [Singulisphaera rosea]